MGKISEWREKHPSSSAGLAQQIAIWPQHLYPYLDKFINPGPNNLSHVSSTKQWLSFYWRGKHVQRAILTCLDPLCTPELIAIFTDYCSKVMENPDDQSLLSKLSSDLIQTDLNAEKQPSDLDSTEDLPITPELLFFLKVVLPSWLFYAENHTFLLCAARRGNSKALYKLLRLDKAVVADRIISAQILNASFNNPVKFSEISNALLGKPKNSITPRKVKVLLASLIDVISRENGHELTSPAIQDLFDAVAVDYGFDEARDTDLHEIPDSFDQALVRGRPFWETFVKKFATNFTTKLKTGQI